MRKRRHPRNPVFGVGLLVMDGRHWPSVGMRAGEHEKLTFEFAIGGSDEQNHR